VLIAVVCCPHSSWLLLLLLLYHFRLDYLWTVGWW
jgi:1-acyl-sn-glycerol-3-phosphate acyltransferase